MGVVDEVCQEQFIPCIGCVMLGAKSWRIELDVVKFRHWSDVEFNCKVKVFLKNKKTGAFLVQLPLNGAP